MTTDSGAHGLVRSTLTRRWRAGLLVTALVGLSLTFALDRLEVRSYQRVGRYLVTSAEARADQQLVTANTDRAARDYASVIQRDRRLLRLLADAVGRPATAVGDRMQTDYVPGASTVLVRYRGAGPDEVRAFFARLDAALAAGTVGGLSVPPGQIRALTPDGKVSKELDPLRAHPALGLLGGLAVGATVALALERSRPRVSSVGQLQSVTIARVVPVLEGSAASAATLAAAVFDTEPPPAVVHVVPLRPGDPGTATVVRDSLAAGIGDSETSTGHRPEIAVRTDADDKDGAVTIVAVRPGDPLRPLANLLVRSESTLVALVAQVST